METEILPFTESEDTFDVYVARPDGDGPHPAVLVCHAWAGRDELAEERARRLAELGYIGAAIDVYGCGKRATTRAECQALMMPLIEDPPLLRRRLAAAYQAVRGLEGVDGDRMGAMGFCFGGLCAVLCARMGLDLRGVVSFHGLLKIGEKLEEEVRARVLVLHGQDDPMAPPADIGTFAEEMKRIKAEWQLHVYPGVLHAFTDPAVDDRDFGTVYDAEADRRSWAEMKSFFAEVLG